MLKTPSNLVLLCVFIYLFNERWINMYGVIDVSCNQTIGSIDFEAIKESNIQGVIARAGYGNSAAQKDINFDYFIEQAKQAGHKTGVYWFCYARSADEAAREADAYAEVLNGISLDYPVVYDIEGDTVRYMNDNGIEATSELISDIALAFADRMAEHGYNTMLYANESFIYEYFDGRLTKYPLWVAMYPTNPNISEPFTMDGWNIMGWQYTSTNGNINGAPQHLDVSMFYDDNNSNNESEENNNMTREEAGICIETCYCQHFDRPADPEGKEAYINAIIDRDFDCDLSDVDNAMINSDEYYDNFTRKAYRLYLNRDPENDEVVIARRHYPSLRMIMADILRSDEYKNRH